MKRLIIYLPFLILTLIFAVRVFVSFKYPVFYDYDEMVISAISKEDLPTLIDSVKAEPHPPGIYLLLKLTGLGKSESRILMATLGFLITVSIFTVIYRENVVRDFSLCLGLILFLISDTFFEIFSRIKQDLISLPLLIGVFFVALTLLNTKKYNLKKLILIHLLTFVTLAFGYIPYLQALFITAIVSVLFSKEIMSILLFVVQLAVFVVYFLVFGSEQMFLMLSHNRIGWLYEFTNSFINSLSKFLTGQGALDVYSDVMLLFFLCFVYLGVLTKNSKKNIIQAFVVVFAFVLMLASYFFHAFTRERYVLFLFFLLCLIAGWGLKFIYEKYEKLQKIILICLIGIFIYSTFRQTYFEIIHNNKVVEFNQQVEKAAGNQRTGIIFESATYGFLHTLEFGLSDNIVPFDPYHPDTKKEDVMSRKFLFAEHYLPKLTDHEIRANFQSTGINNFIYLLGVRNNNTKYDPEKISFSVLSQTCQQKLISYPDPATLLYHFQNCNF